MTTLPERDDRKTTPAIQEGVVRWRSPSNIAIVKYWGKYGEQMPCNPSLSLTLSKAYTETQIRFGPRKEEVPAREFSFHGNPAPQFARRIESYLERLADVFPVINETDLHIDSENSFPHSAGIASSASAMSALALGIGEIAYKAESKFPDKAFMQRVSQLARLGSGSACRSVFGPAALWGEAPEIPESSQEYAIPVEIHSDFHRVCDTILIVDDAAKAVSSRAGHMLMEGHIFASARFAQARSNLKRLLPALRNGDFETFGRIAEDEALTLHAMMMTSKPAYVLIKPNTLAIIEEIRKLRQERKVPVCFTLDAGPNVHLLYPGSAKKVVEEWIGETLMPLCKNGLLIHDRVGTGPEKLE